MNMLPHYSLVLHDRYMHAHFTESETVVFQPGGETTMSITFNIMDDQRVEPDESITVMCSSPDLPPESIPTPAITIIDNDMRKRKRPIVPEALSITPFPSMQLLALIQHYTLSLKE